MDKKIVKVGTHEIQVERLGVRCALIGSQLVLDKIIDPFMSELALCGVGAKHSRGGSLRPQP